MIQLQCRLIQAGANRAKEFARLLDIEVVVLKKSRHRVTGEVSVDESLELDISKRDALVIDDIISSGISIIKTAEVLHKKGVGKIFAMCTHALLIRDANSENQVCWRSGHYLHKFGARRVFQG